jgi:hypothetical protein
MGATIPLWGDGGQGEGEVLLLSACLESGGELPSPCRFDCSVHAPVGLYRPEVELRPGRLATL